jgi:hypothetical protein
MPFTEILLKDKPKSEHFVIKMQNLKMNAIFEKNYTVVSNAGINITLVPQIRPNYGFFNI